ncbi:MAG: tRNA pseudouridine(55) synthase TruB [Phycisphaerales bacterium]|nr:tRNA pseudouridine(55) synthase TruB [Phycisphaerales bacterium]
MAIPDNASTPIAGIILIDKPEGPTSMRVIERVRRAAGGVRCGHAGTLDPLATGLLVVALGRFTKEIDRLMAGDKKYETVIDLSAFTATDDREGERIAVSVSQPPTESQIELALQSFRGSIMQTPPAFSAVKIGGRRSYDIARRTMKAAQDTQEPPPSSPIQPAPRPAAVHELAIRAYAWPLLTLDIHCAKGFYVRSLARDLGSALGTGGHCKSIRRTWSAPFSIAHAIALDSLPERLCVADLARTS